jgi:hypothetical protein
MIAVGIHESQAVLPHCGMVVIPKSMPIVVTSEVKKFVVTLLLKRDA